MVMYSDHMSKRMTATETKARLLSVLDEVSAGMSVEITKRGKVVARLVPPLASKPSPGALAAVATSAASDEDLFTTGLNWDAE